MGEHRNKEPRRRSGGQSMKKPGSRPEAPPANPSKKISSARLWAVTAVLAALGGTAYFALRDSGPKPVQKPKNAIVDSTKEHRVSEAEKVEGMIFSLNLRAFWAANGNKEAIGGGDDDKQIAKFIEKAENLLKTLDPIANDTFILSKLLADLKADFLSGGASKIKLDQSFELIKAHFAKLISDFQKQDAKGTALEGFSSELKEMGIDTDYVILSKQPGAKTIVVLSQAHGNSVAPQFNAGETASGRHQNLVKASQVRSWESAGKLAEKFQPVTVFNEGSPNEDEYDPNDPADREVFDSAARRGKVFGRYIPALKRKFGNGVRIIGMEEKFLHTYRTEQLGKMTFLDEEKILALLNERSDSDNIFLASNIADTQRSLDSNLGIVIIGLAHEQEVPMGPGKKMGATSFPLSRLLAAQGFNVLVAKNPESETVLEDLQKMLENQ